ncbi:zinc-binding dehydrogenase, partial [Microbacterium sp. Cr-K1W]
RAARDHDLDGAAVRIHGAGLVGLSAAAIAAEQGATVEVLDPNPDRRALAARFGATSLDREPDVVIEASGHAVGEALAGVTVGGTVVLVGSVFPADPVPFDAESIVRRLVTVAGIHNYTGAELAAAVAFLAGRGRAYPFGDAVGAVRGLHEIDAALEEAAAADAPLRIGLLPGH